MHGDRSVPHPKLRVCLKCITLVFRIFVSEAKSGPAMARLAGVDAMALLKVQAVSTLQKITGCNNFIFMVKTMKLR